MTEQAQRIAHKIADDARTLRALHVPGNPLLLANVWDPATARIVASVGMRAIATTSAGLAQVNGYRDHGQLPPDVAFGALRRIADAVKLPVTADLENGYGLCAEELVDRIVAAGACGLNLEDTDHATKSLVDADKQAARINAIKAAAHERAIDLVVNARIDVHLHRHPIDEGLHRAKQYFAAGADSVYPFLLSDIKAIRDYVALGQTNALWRPGGPPLREFAQAGVSRISIGPFLFQQMLKRLGGAAAALQSLDDQGLI